MIPAATMPQLALHSNTTANLSGKGLGCRSTILYYMNRARVEGSVQQRKGGVIVTAYHVLASISNQAAGLQITVIGLGVVFGVLALLWGVMVLLNLAFREPITQIEPTPPTETEPEAVEEPKPAAPEVSRMSPQMIAAVTAAVYAIFGYVPGDMTIRPALGRQQKKKVAAMAAAVFSHSDTTSQNITIRKVEGR